MKCVSLGLDKGLMPRAEDRAIWCQMRHLDLAQPTAEPAWLYGAELGSLTKMVCWQQIKRGPATRRFRPSGGVEQKRGFAMSMASVLIIVFKCQHYKSTGMIAE